MLWQGKEGGRERRGRLGRHGKEKGRKNGKEIESEKETGR